MRTPRYPANSVVRSTPRLGRAAALCALVLCVGARAFADRVPVGAEGGAPVESRAEKREAVAPAGAARASAATHAKATTEGAGSTTIAAAETATRAGSAATGDDPYELLLAKRYYEFGVSHYVLQEYARALDDFETARRFRPAPALDYNIARCLDRLERPAEAAQAYERYLALAHPDDDDAAEVRTRIDVLRQRLARSAPPGRHTSPAAP